MRARGLANLLDASGQVQLFLIGVFEHRSKVKGSRGGRGHAGSSVSDKGGAPDRPGAEASGCEGALTAVPGGGPGPGTLREQQEQECGESTLWCSLMPSHATGLEHIWG